VDKVALDYRNDEAIKDYEEFVAEWEVRIRCIVLNSKAFQFCDVDDIVQELLLSLYQKDYLSLYDPTKGTKFSTFIYNFVSRSILGKRDRYARRVWREGLSLSVQEENDDEITFFDTLEASPETLSSEFIDLVTSIYKQLKETPVTSAINDFPRLFSSIVQQIVFGISPECIIVLGEEEASKSGRFGINRKALAYDLGLSESSVSVMLKNFSELALIKTLLPK
jgi:DNA-directed RNA polymerase specialized sigma24 family protein